MPRGDKSSYSSKQKRMAHHIEEGYEGRGVGSDEVVFVGDVDDDGEEGPGEGCFDGDAFRGGDFEVVAADVGDCAEPRS